MVKGTTRQVLVVRPQESDLFEQAIFLLREEALEQHGVTEQALLEEARRLAAAPPSARPHRRIPALLYAAMGAASVGLAWLSCVLIFKAAPHHCVFGLRRIFSADPSA